MHFHRSMSGNTCHVGNVCIATLPNQRTEVFGVTQSATNLRIDIKQWHYNAVMTTSHIDNADHTFRTDNSHFWTNTICFTFVDSDKIIGFVQCHVDHLSRKDIVLQRKFRQTLYAVLSHNSQLLPHLKHFFTQLLIRRFQLVVFFL